VMSSQVKMLNQIKLLGKKLDCQALIYNKYVTHWS
jgi:hypothetical protein